MLGVVIGAENRVESGTGRRADAAQKACLVSVTVPAVQHADPPAVLQDEGGNIDSIGVSMFGQLSRCRAVDVPTAV